MKRNNSYSHILKYTGLFGGVQGLNILVGVVRNKFTALFLGPSGMGLLALFNSTSSFVSTMANLGIPTSGVKMVADASAQTADASAQTMDTAVCQVRTLSLLFALVGTVVCALLGPLLNLTTFSWGNHTWQFVLLSPTVFFTILGGGEMAILKGMGKLKRLAMQAFLLALLSLLFAVPIYGFLGESGILAVLFLLALSQWALGFWFLRREVSFHLDFSKKALAQCIPMIRLGLSFVLAGMMGAGAEFLVRAFLNVQGDLNMVGLFNAGATIVLVYGGMIFTVMDSDYYPRLSAVGRERKNARAIGERNSIVNKQMEINLLLILPIIFLLILLLPYLIPLMYSQEFMGMLEMAQVSTVGLLFKAMYLPIEYIPLSRGDSKVYLVQECCAVVLLVVAEIMGYTFAGLTGIGWGILIAYAIETVGVVVFCSYYYGYRLSFLRYFRFLP